jgi:TRAP-type mannitol/chloroaromatic compound transport system substrate-binding protein
MTRITPNAIRKLDRRRFMGAAGVAAAASTTLARPAVAQSSPELKWRMPMFVPKSVESVVDGANDFSRRVAELSDGRFQITPFGVGDIVPGGPATLAAAEQGTVECAYTLSYYSFGVDPAYAFGTTLPFGPTMRGQYAWLLKNGGLELLNEFFNARGTHAIPVANSTSQMGGFFRKEITKLDDLKGLKMRIPGLGGVVMSKLGVIPQQIPAGEIYSALERGTIDAAEWAAPYDDFKFGFHRVAQNYYAPGWWEPQATIMVFVNLAKWQELPKQYRVIIETAALATCTTNAARCDTLHSDGLRQIIAAGAKLRYFSQELLDASYDASFKVFEELQVKSPAFAKIYPAWKKHIDDHELYYRVGDNTYENYVYNKRVKG